MLELIFQENASYEMQHFLWAGVMFGVVFLGLLLLKFVSRFSLSRLQKTHTLRRDFLQMISGISRFALGAFSAFFASLSLPFSKGFRIFFSALFVLALVREVGALIKFFLKVVMEKGFPTQDIKTKKNLTEILNTIFQVLLWIFAALIFFDSIGVALTPLLASLGVGGIAVAFASQKLIEDFFSSFSIMGSSPFRIGDIITLNGTTGTVKKIGLRTTTLQTVEGKSIIIPNRLVVANIVENSGTIKTRRKRFSLTLTYETPVEKLRKLSPMLEEIIGKHQGVQFEWAMLRDLQASCLEVLVSYVVESDDRLLATQLHEQILLEILEKFAQEGIEFAYPTQTLWLKKEL
ncbi:MAG: hypothetical protein DLD55_06185 [candidate division SR1 bacterium]|nr:MAG: hypothetical protein DLD55_06185 [candidate division SR1 bacterium]